MDPLTLPLSSEQITLNNAGGKGANLHRLAQAGFPVPPGFVLTTDAYRAFVQANDLLSAIQAAQQTTRSDDPASFAAASSTIRQAFAQGVMPPPIAAAITSAYAALPGSAAVAVRSSATAEDLPEASFAGQQETYLNVQGEKALLEAVVRCWSSLWTARAMAYRARQTVALESVSLAVVVQKMVPARSAGVLFTVNPVSGNTGEIVINATWGLGEALVAGQVTPDTFVVAKQDGQVVERTIGDKAVMTATTATGTAEIDVATAQRRQAALSDEQASELAGVGRAIEDHFGQPQDVEWAIADDGTVYVLQSRPVTTQVAPPQPTVPGDDAWPPTEIASQPFDRWTQADVGERWPEPVTPLTWSTSYPMLNENMGDTFAGLDPDLIQRIEWAKRAYGHVYFNEGALIHVFTRGYGMPASRLGGSLANPEYIRPEENRWRWGTALRRLPLLFKLMSTWERNVRKFEQEFDRLDRWVEDFMQRDLSTVDDVELWRQCEATWYTRLMTYMAYHANATSMSINAFHAMEERMEKWMGRKELVYDLLAGLNGVIAAEIAPSLWQITRRLQAAGLADVVLENEPAQALAALRRTPAAQPILDEFDAFLRRHGHRCMTEAEWLYPRWREAPEQVIELIVGYLQADEPFDPQAAEAKQAARRAAAIALIEARLDPLRKIYFRRELRRLQRFMRLRDNGQNFLVKLILPIRHIYATLGERWAQRKWLEKPEDFFFLVVPEIEAVLAGGDPAAAGLDLHVIVSERRRAYDYWFTQDLPDVLGPDGKPLVAAPAAASGAVLAGVAASSGLVQGVARVVLSPQEAQRLRPGEILVTRATDPGWTPVFSLIGGLVLEVGGQLSHGAIVAREYGLPAVVNVPGATQRIRSGQSITVDGSAGQVYFSSD